MYGHRDNVEYRYDMGMRYPLLYDVAWLRARYVDDRMSTLQIAKLAGVLNDNATTVRRALVRAGIPRRSISEATVGRPSSFKGRSHSDGTKAKWRAARLGKPSKAVWTEEMRAEMRCRMSGENAPNFKHGAYSGSGNGRGGRARARKLYAEPQPCQRCGASRTERHHRDEDPTNNQPENIEWLCRRCHRKHHAGVPEGQWTMKHDACIECGTSTRKHGGFGLCVNCYRRQWKKK